MSMFEETTLSRKLEVPLELLLAGTVAFMCVAHYKSTVEYYKLRHGKKKPPALVYFGPFVIALLYTCWNLNMFVSYVSVLGWMPFKYDSAAIEISSLLYLAAKTLTYLLSVCQIHSSFKGTLFAYTAKSIVELCAFVGIYVVSMLAIIGFFAWERSEYANRRAPLIFVLPFLLFDLFFSSLLLFLFLSRLKDFKENTKSTADSDKKDDQMEIFPLKYALMKMIALMAPLISLTIYVVTGTGYILPVDGLLNCACIFLLTAPLNKQFLGKCTPFLVCVASVPCLMQDAHQIELSAHAALNNSLKSEMNLRQTQQETLQRRKQFTARFG